MSTFKPMFSVVAATAAAFALPPTSGTARAQMPKLQLEVHGGVGFTSVDRNKWSGYGDANLSNWNYMNYQGAVQLFARLPKMDAGLEVGYQYFWWYTYTYFITTTNWVTANVSATHVHAVVRLPTGPRMTLEVGAGPYFFERGTDFGGHAAFGLSIPVAPRVAIPLQLRLDAILDSDGGTMLPLGLTAGLAFKL